MADVNTPRKNNGTGDAAPPIAYCLEDLKVGMAATFSKTVTDADVVAFAGLSGDTNPIHLDEAYAAKTMFKGRIAHGILSAAYISAALATRLPGAGAVYVSQSLKFKAPVRIGDTVTARIEVVAILPEKKFVTFKTQCLVGEKVVLDGEATLMVPRRAAT
jgi:3-hydroxybutyryl-CoA dehydratase